MTTNEFGSLTRRALLRHGLTGAGVLAAGRFLGGALRADPILDPIRLTAGDVGAPPIVTRAQWGADESLRSGTPSWATIRKLVVHHTATPNDEDPVAAIQAIYRFHTQSRGWNDIGYNFVIDRVGRIYEGRWARDYLDGEVHNGENTAGRGIVGAHVSGFNTGSVGVALLGTYTDGRPTDATLDSLVALLAWKASAHRIDPFGASPYTATDGTTTTFANITGHRDLGDTACPGGAMYEMLGDIRVRVAARVSSTLPGYRILAADGAVRSFGGAGDAGDVTRLGITTTTRALATTPGGDGYWVLGTDGGIFSFGDAAYFGSVPGLRIRTTVVDMAATPSGAGYWVLGTDGGVFCFGDAAYFGSVPGLHIRTTVVKLAPTPSGKGYWVLGADGGVFCFGDALYFGSLPGIGIRTQAVDLMPTPSGKGYWLLGADGGVFCFGDAGYFGSVPGLRISWSQPARALVATPTGLGYIVLASDGGVFCFGDAPYHGSAAGWPHRAVDLAPVIPS